ncbi:Predicted DNA-binding transcriptional regulator YafY, contains an HTH and WYL domains [Paenibacillus sp. UNCCL117]|uniref:helix-turn-helix transcriptional regulator n=1 Tax=unclassified Paenibacillus TaxID=185978 RepID=UPI00087F49EC|nr:MULTISPECIES: WYL domain-containing protein [unclassified Paenibacillus]SDD18010.1 Predicted DNA-binding transcriptional regulator YafY, contains an HTH and WYL domains [Paenibacillus sp. cl123]SFW35121.1 Predicted DNA-binding transcriptional regulator YafY, contains an HTH and WYL domains [Paenibacillus sp. UNCCL117]
MAKWDNMLMILWQLRAKRQVTAEQLAETLETSVRTVYRYIDALCASGVPIIAEPGHDGGYSLPGTFKQAPLFLTDEERKALSQAALFAHGAGYPFEERLQQALRKIQLYAGDAWSDEGRPGRAAVGSLDIVPTSDHRSLRSLLQLLDQAIESGVRMQVRYAKQAGNVPETRELDPYGLTYRFDNWYAVAYCHTRRSVRTFRVDRIRDARLTGQTFDRPEQFSLKAYLRQELAEQASGRAQTVCPIRLTGDSDSLRRLSRHWYLCHCIVRQEENLLQLSVPADIADAYMPELLLGYGPKIIVHEPASLREALSRLIRRMAEQYGMVQPEQGQGNV